MAALAASARSLLTSGALAHLVTLNADGSPQVTCVWVGLGTEAGGANDEIVFASLGRWRKLQNLERDPRVVLSMEGQGTSPAGLREYLVVHGRARLEAGGAPAVLRRLAEVYLGPGVKFPPMDDPPPGIVVHIEIDKVGGVGPWATPGGG